MTTKKTVVTIGMIIFVLLALKIYSDRMRKVQLMDYDVGQEAAELPVPEFPVGYSLGTFDERFGISKERFLKISEQAMKVWEDAAGKVLFVPDEDGTLKVNLIFDWRQERLLEAKKAKAKLDGAGGSFDQLQSIYDDRGRMLDQYRRYYEESAGTYKIHLEEYNANVSRWNESKEHSESEYRVLQSAKKRIEDERDALGKSLADLNGRGRDFNELGDKLSALANRHNLDVEKFNGKYVESRDFEKGLFDGKAINIYEFEKEEDLKLTLVHEFGHAIGLGHVNNPKAIMYRKLALQDFGTIRLTSDDLNLLRTRIQ